MQRNKGLIGKIGITLTLMFLYIPIITMIVFSFNEKRSLSVWGGFSLKWYAKLFEGRQMMETVSNTLIIAVLATLISVVIGTITAIGLSKSNKVIRGKIGRASCRERV